jgi:AraC-like DNA-binding protein
MTTHDGGTGVGIVSARAADPSQAEELITELYLPNRIVGSDGASLDLRVDAAHLGSSTVGRITYGDAVRVVTDPGTHLHVNATIAGRATSAAGDAEPVVTHPGSATVWPTGRPASIAWSPDCVQLCVMTPVATLETELEELLGHSLSSAVRFDFGMDLERPEARSFRQTVELVNGQLQARDASLAHPRVGQHLERLLVDGLLLGHQHNYREELVAGARPAAHAAVARAVELVNERFGEAWSSTSLARAVHVSLRSLQEGFARDLGTSPMTYLRDVRLRAVRQRLLVAPPDSTTVARVATACGFVHLGRFAAAYRTAFGEAPSATLRRAPRW